MTNFQSYADVPREPHYINPPISLNLSPSNSRHQSQILASSQASFTLTFNSQSQDSLDPIAAVPSDNSSERQSEHHSPTHSCKSQFFSKPLLHTRSRASQKVVLTGQCRLDQDKNYSRQEITINKQNLDYWQRNSQFCDTAGGN